jgi:hypothetical protein
MEMRYPHLIPGDASTEQAERSPILHWQPVLLNSMNLLEDRYPGALAC